MDGAASPESALAASLVWLLMNACCALLLYVTDCWIAELATW